VARPKGPDPANWQALDRHLAQVRGCRICPTVVPPPVAARPEVWPRLMLVGQAPGPKEVVEQRPFAYTAGSRLFSWFERLGVSEQEFRRRVWMCAVIRCFPGRAPQGGDRVPSPLEIANCAPYLEEEIQLIRPATVLAVGQLAIKKFLPEPMTLNERVGKSFPSSRGDVAFDVIPLPHPSGRSTWLNAPGNQDRLDRALELVRGSAGWKETFG
jgi:uracil-DNA glycosylase